MSCFTQIKTKLVDATSIEEAARDLGYEVLSGKAEVRGWSGRTTKAAMVLRTSQTKYDIGAVRNKDGTYSFVSDWSMSSVKQKDFVARLSQRYSYRRVTAQAKAQGFVVAREKVADNGAVQLVLRKFV